MSNGIRLYSAGPLSVFLLLILFTLVIILIPLLILGIIGSAFTRLGFSWIIALAMVLLMISGSLVNIPVYRIKRDIIRVPENNPSFFDGSDQGVSARVWDTLISINLGGAVIPLCASMFMIYRAIPVSGYSIVLTVGAGISVVAAITFISTRVVTFSGIRVPLLIPGLAALLAGLFLGGGTGLTAAVTAFVSGTTGVLLGGNIAQLQRLQEIEVPEVSLGGAGTFGSVFICCMLPALIA
jgi:uncharacterized membrane protein